MNRQLEQQMRISYQMIDSGQQITENIGNAREHSPWDIIHGSLQYSGEGSVTLGRVEITIPMVEGIERVYHQKMMMADLSGFLGEDGSGESWYVTGLLSSDDTARIFGWDDLSDFFCGFSYTLEGRKASLTGWIDCEGIEVESGHQIELPGFYEFEASDLFSGLQGYAAAVAEKMGARTEVVPAGWCSWYYYYDTLKEQDLWGNLDKIKELGLDEKGVSVIQIDDGWNLPEAGAPKVWGDWEAGMLFPEGMKAAADRIHTSGLQAGLWLAPFAVTPESRLFREHPEWCVQSEGAPIVCYGIHVLDLSHPEVISYLRETFLRVFDDWGYDYVKLDFLHFAACEGDRYDTRTTTAMQIRNTMQMIRDIAKDRFILACGAPFGPLVGLVDGMRTGHDISSRWDLGMPVEEANGPYIAVQVAAREAFLQQWMHRMWWANDPDCLITRDYAPEAEMRLFSEVLTQYGDAGAFGLSAGESKFWRDFIWISGTMGLISENLMEFGGERLDLLESTFPQYRGDVQIIGGSLLETWILSGTDAEGNKEVGGLFNLSDTRQTVIIPDCLQGLAGTDRIELDPRSSKLIGV